VIRVREEKREMTLWTQEQTKRVLDEAAKFRLYPLFYLALVTGLRIGELLGLQWQDIQDDMLTVKRTLTTRGRKHFFSTPKTERGYRVVTLPEDAVELLKQHKVKQDEERSFLGDSWTETGHVFVDELGNLLKQRGVLYIWHNIQEDADVPRARLHDLRHMHVSLLIKNGVDPRTVADRVGHADPSFTLDQYSHVFNEQRRAAALSLNDLLKESKKDDK
jgi:integrase